MKGNQSELKKINENQRRCKKDKKHQKNSSKINEKLKKIRRN